MAIKLRVNQATALTYKEMDRNFSSFFYSASIQNGDTLQLWYTGSSALNGPGENYEPYAVTIPLQPTEGDTPTLIVAGTENGHIQIKNGNQLGYSSEFIYNSQGFLGVGTGAPTVKTHIKGNTSTPSILRLESINTLNNVNRRSTIEFNHGTRNYGIIGKDNYADNNLYIKTYADGRFGAIQGSLIFNIGTNPNAGAFTTAGFGIGTLAPQHPLQVEGNGYFTGNVGIGDVPNIAALNVYQNTQLQATSGEFTHIAKFGISPLANSTFLNITAVRTSGGSDWLTEGLRLQNLIDSSYKSYIQFNGHDNLDGFSIGTGNTDTAQGGNYNDVPERFRVDAYGRVGINTKTPVEALTVSGSISGSGNFKVNGTVTVGTIAAGSAATTSALVTTSAGLVQKIDAAPIPKGGIIMWSGAISAIPPGWYLCNGSNNTPDLRDRFVVGAGSTYAVAATGGSKDAVVVSHTHTATAAATTDLTGAIGSIRNAGGLVATGVFSVQGYNGEDSGDGQSSAVLNFNANHGHAIAVNTVGESGTNKNLPPYYALAYIMYGGI